jgi:hypothetical protein
MVTEPAQSGLASLGRPPSYFFGEGAMLGAPDDRHVGPRFGSRDEPAERLAALDGRREVKRAPVEFPADRRHHLVSSLGALADERKIATGGQEPPSRARRR